MTQAREQVVTRYGDILASTAAFVVVRGNHAFEWHAREAWGLAQRTGAPPPPGSVSFERGPGRRPTLVTFFVSRRPGGCDPTALREWWFHLCLRALAEHTGGEHAAIDFSSFCAKPHTTALTEFAALHRHTRVVMVVPIKTPQRTVANMFGTSVTVRRATPKPKPQPQPAPAPKPKRARVVLAAHVRGRNTRLGLVGPTGSAFWQRELLTSALLETWARVAEGVPRERWGFHPETTTLVGNGTPWASHLAVMRFLDDGDKYPALVLHLPARFDVRGASFLRFERDYTREQRDAATVMNRLHGEYERATGRSSLRELARAIDCGATVRVHKGMEAAAAALANECDALLALDMGNAAATEPGGDTARAAWKKARRIKLCVPARGALFAAHQAGGGT